MVKKIINYFLKNIIFIINIYKIIMKILIAGAGGMCSELLKQLKFYDHDITIVDYDTVEQSNLHRTIFYTENDLNFLKTEVLRKFGYKTINNKIQNVNLNGYDVIISTLDNLESRMDLNLLFMECNTRHLIDVGVNGLKGHIKVVNKKNSCLFCIKYVYDKEDVSCGRINDEIIPSVVYFNSIIAGCLAKVLMSIEEYDFLFVNCEECHYYEKITLKKDDDCIVCNKFNKL